MPDPSSQPTARIEAFDVSRALAILGMILVNFSVASGVHETGPPWLQWIEGLFVGRAAALFVVLAGVGLSLMTRSARLLRDPGELARARRRIWIRAAFLLVIGLLDLILWPGDILHFYAFYFALGSLFVLASDRMLWGAAVVSVLGFVVLFFVFDYETAWNWETLHYADLWQPAGMARHLVFNGFHPIFPWLAYLLVGMWLGRRDLLAAGTRRRILAWSLGMAVLVEVGSWLAVRNFTANPGELDPEWIPFLFGTGSMPPLPQYLIAAGSEALAVICVSVVLLRRWPALVAVRWLRVAGRHALTMYFTHVYLGLVALHLLGVAFDNSLGLAMGFGVLFFVVAVLVANLWNRRFRHGPLEWVIRRLAG